MENPLYDLRHHRVLVYLIAVHFSCTDEIANRLKLHMPIFYRDMDVGLPRKCMAELSLQWLCPRSAT